MRRLLTPFLFVLLALLLVSGAAASGITGTTQSSVSATFTGLKCGTAYTVSLSDGQTLPASTQACSVVQTDYYVDSVSGNDSATGASTSTAWKTLGKLNAAVLQPGNKVHIARGSNFAGQQLALAESGTASAPISTSAYGTGAAPIIGGTSTGVLVSGGYNTVADLVSDNNSWAGFEVSGASDTLSNVTASRNEAGFSLKGSGSTTLSNFAATDNSKLSSDGLSGAWGVLLHSANNKIGPGTITGSDAASSAYVRDGSAVEIGAGGNGNAVHHIRAAHNETFSECDGGQSNTFAYDFVAPADTSVDQQGKGFVVKGSTCPGVTIQNTTVVERGSSSQGFVCWSGCSPSVLRLRDDIVVADWKVGYADAAFDNDYNIYFGGTQQFIAGAHDRVVDPKLTSDTDFHLLLGSPAIDTGIATVGYSTDLDGDIVPQGAATDVGADEAAGTVTPPPPTTYTLTVSKSGTGTGTVTSSPAGISCGATCSASYTSGTVVTLTEAPASGSTFAGWSGACTGTSTCTVTLDASKSVGAAFTANVTPPPPPSGSIQHVAWVFMENHSYEQLIGGSSSPYITSLAQTYGSATQMFAETHPSLPNYIASTSGSTQGITDDSGPSSHPLSVPSIYSELPGGQSRTLMESMPSNCYKSDYNGLYVVHDNPMAYYTNLGTDCANYDVPFGTTPDLSAKFTFITPNRCHDMHSNSCAGSSDVIKQGDDFLKGYVPTLMATPQYQAGNTLIIITWDEDSGSNGNHVPAILIYPTLSHATSAVHFTHYSMLKDVEDYFGVPETGGASSAASMRAPFSLP